MDIASGRTSIVKGVPHFPSNFSRFHFQPDHPDVNEAVWVRRVFSMYDSAISEMKRSFRYPGIRSVYGSHVDRIQPQRPSFPSCVMSFWMSSMRMGRKPASRSNTWYPSAERNVYGLLKPGKIPATRWNGSVHQPGRRQLLHCPGLPSGRRFFPRSSGSA